MTVELLWIRDVEKRPVKPPVAILSAASAKIVADWRARNRWCDAVPLTLFGGEELASLHADVFNDDPRNAVPNRVENAPPAAVEAFASIRGRYADLHPNARAWGCYLDACEVVSKYVASPGHPVWVLAADADQGILAVMAAWARGGRVAAIGSGSIGLIGASIAAEKGVDVGVVQHTAELVR